MFSSDGSYRLIVPSWASRSSSPPAQAETRCITPEQKAAEVAKQGPEALRRFILRTRMIYALSSYDFYKPQE